VLLGALELVGVAAFTASGALVGVVKRLDIFGVCVVGIFTGLGGGVVRDVLLGSLPPKTFQDPWILGTSAAIALLVFWCHPAVRRRQREVAILDALGMGLFASGGATTALSLDAGPLAAGVIGAVTAVGGGVLRDIMVNEVPMLLHRDLYAVPALLGSALAVAATALGASPGLAVLAGTLTATTIRLLALWRNWSLPHPRLPPSAS
jgi:uncharacterized membrane protein YeiH